MKAILVQTTCSSKEEAKIIAKILIEEKLAACVQMSEINSFYIWEKEFCNDEEILLSIKTKKENFKKIKSKIKELHSYDVPEIISLDINDTSKDYRKFIDKNC
ncbi:divalent-cation tolerance protein CutA [Halarcobacter bivalviorum]|uniref:CutA divalent ion tolerance protein n=1 Tax=Halarcobacter bivalviorum TaxID=663364 RepID=A0AAX2A5N3_9BACT|nr:divalent-cation tolerance protein CutA [Halarcobacter bivalviorum]AXH11273.1 putative CutA divalent ion tolerance protein [Halarcobacter bivalviorum]RXK09542.1 divalent-cation tolerance protein CutA [Halarcobacter bivalviorum]